ncbi:hypothetical protein [Hymenobacter psoromatis]|nr:hypothetical protein [Hymenobacter psoromatis]
MLRSAGPTPAHAPCYPLARSADGLCVLAPLDIGQAAFDFVQTHQRR